MERAHSHAPEEEEPVKTLGNEKKMPRLDTGPTGTSPVGGLVLNDALHPRLWGPGISIEH